MFHHSICQTCLKKITSITLRRYSVKTNNTKWKSKNVRQAFLDFFCQKHDHQFVKSSSVIPGKGEGTYFTNAGMNQFKPIFLGATQDHSELQAYKRVANSQKCVRVGGKHNDLDDVGRDYTHHTFFEMLGSWSFGDYFKQEACSMALNLLVGVYGLPLERLYFTYFGGDPSQELKPDLECREIWRELGVPEAHILPYGMEDNFWDMGDTGPCGPCTEIHYDHLGSRDAGILVNTGLQEVVEIWNIVFMQYNRLGAGHLVPLPSHHVDTGMGLERICAVLQGTRSNYNTDLFLPIFDAIHKETGIGEYGDKVGSADTHGLDTAYRIIADHTRMATVCVSDGLLPGRLDLQNRLRMVLDRALHQCHQVLRVEPGLLPKLVQPIIDSLGDPFPEVSQHASKTQEILMEAEDRYLLMYSDGRKNFEKLMRKNPELKSVNGETLWRLRDGWFGHPMSPYYIEILASQFGLSIARNDMEDLSSAGQQVPIEAEVQYPCFTAELLNELSSREVPPTDDDLKYVPAILKFNEFPTVTSTISCLVDDGNKLSERVNVGDRVGVIVGKTQFYAEKGGQVGDVGFITSETGEIEVKDTQCSQGHILHVGIVTRGHMEKGQELKLDIDPDHRVGCMRNHTATHLLNAALHHVLGSEVKQRGSHVSPGKLTFDFSCSVDVNIDDIYRIESMVWSWLGKGDRIVVERELTPLKHALQLEGIVYLENAVYPDHVYVVTVRDPGTQQVISRELCGGTHVTNSEEIEDFCITSLTGHTSAVKSVVCLTGRHAVKAKHKAVQTEQMYKDLITELKSNEVNLDKCLQLQKEINAVLGRAVLPKLVKDDLKQKMDSLGTDINTLINKHAFMILEKELTRRMDEPGSDIIVHSFTVKVLPKLNKMMKKLSVRRPLILVVQATNNTNAYVCVPKHSPITSDTLVQELCKMVQGQVTQQEENYTVITVKGDNFDMFLEAANRVQANYITEKTSATKN
ncbi:alanine--tRNA ligase, cytoplasmic-like isoform X2 [Mya arenaria]|nr:alanine--tRNA ligase, cytoplasmic-like isoform X2 [Mya arenaria]XP_052785003.1 alanine--tRNA ligase, cytoplasmic-like isoform X2 [Mya arenaria]